MPYTNTGSGPLTNNPMIEWDGSYEACTPDTGQTGIKIGVLVYRSASASANAITLASAYRGYELEDASEIGIVVGPPSAPWMPQTYDYNTTAATAATDTVWVHWLKLGDVMWLISGSISVTYGQTMWCAANGLVALTAAGTTADKYNCHLWEAKLTTSSKTAQLGKYIGMGAVDTS